MPRIATLFCHVPEGMSEDETQQELHRQHDVLAQYAAKTGRVIEHCFFHVGAFDCKHPDKVFLRFLQRAQAKDLGLVFVESEEQFPIAQQALIPRMELYFVQEDQREMLGSEDVQIEVEDLQFENIHMYRGF